MRSTRRDFLRSFGNAALVASLLGGGFFDAACGSSVSVNTGTTPGGAPTNDQLMEAIENAAPRHIAAVRHCFANVLTPQQLDALGDIADALTAHLAAEHAPPTADDDC